MAENLPGGKTQTEDVFSNHKMGFNMLTLKPESDKDDSYEAKITTTAFMFASRGCRRHASVRTEEKGVYARKFCNSLRSRTLPQQLS